MTPAPACVEEAQQLATEGNPITYKVYPGAYHVFDRPNQPYRKFQEGTFAKCAIDTVMPSRANDPAPWGPAYNRATNQTLATPQERDAAIKQCAATLWITVESNPKAREQAVQDVLAFLASNQ